MADAQKDDPFKNMGLIKFWVVSSLFWISFPASLLFRYIILGAPKTRQLLTALWDDFLQTILVLLIVLSLATYGIYYYSASLFSGLF